MLISSRFHWSEWYAKDSTDIHLTVMFFFSTLRCRLTDLNTTTNSSKKRFQYIRDERDGFDGFMHLSQEWSRPTLRAMLKYLQHRCNNISLIAVILLFHFVIPYVLFSC